MRPDRILILARREYLARVRTPAFWISTLALPVLMVAMAFLPTLLLMRGRSELRVAVVDGTGRLGPAIAARLATAQAEPAPGAATAGDAAPAADAAKKPGAGGSRRDRSVRFDVALEPPQPDAAAQRAALDRRVLDKSIDAWVWISEADLAEDHVEYHARSVSNFVTLSVLERALSDVVRRQRLADAGFDADRVEQLSHRVDLQTIKVSEGGSKKEAAEAGMIFAYLLFFLLYIMLILYGTQVLNGVLEEKTSRVVEVVVSTVRPFELMMGKLFGIGAVGLTQLALWMTTIAVVTAPGIVATMSWLPAGVDIPTLSPALVANFFLFFVLGYFLYASFYAAVGAAFNNLQEAQQVASFVGFLFIVPAMFFMPVLNDPDSTLAVVSSLVPPLTPLVMLLRVAVKTPPLWQLLLSYALTIGFTVFMVWLAARIYRIGILMYGKKPTFQELWRWLRYA